MEHRDEKWRSGGCDKRSLTSGVQTGGPLGAVKLPLLDLEVGAGPLQAGVPSQLGEELQHGALDRGGRRCTRG